MKKLITSVFLVFGLYSNGSAQVDTCKVDYFNMFNTDSVFNIWGYNDPTYIYLYDEVNKRYKDKVFEIFKTDRFFTHVEAVGGGEYNIIGFHLVTSKGIEFYYTPCEMELMFK